MLTDVMDFDPRITYDGHGWHCNFHLGFGHDVILEDAANEKSCVQALQRLIPKADTEIHDLEDELAILQCQLKWSESDKQRDPYEVCCATFKQKIDYLTKSMKNLRNKRILNEDDMDTPFTIQRPAEKIYDIINTLTKQNFSASEEQVEDLSKEMNSLINSGSVNVSTDLREKETTSDLSAESKELISNFERQFKVPKPMLIQQHVNLLTLCAYVILILNYILKGLVLYAHKIYVVSTYVIRFGFSYLFVLFVFSDEQPVDTASEESCSDIARYAIKDSFEARALGKTYVEVTRNVEVDAYECTPEGSNVYNSQGKSKVNVLQHEETEECMAGSKNSGRGSSSSSAKTEMIVKVEVDNPDFSIRHIAADSFLMMQNQECKDLIEGCQEVKENQSPSADGIEITYGRNRKKTGLSAILKPQGRKVQRKTFNGAKQANPMMLKPQGKIGKRSFPSNGNNFRQPESPSSKVDVGFRRFPETMLQRKSMDIAQSEEVHVSEDGEFYDQGPVSKSHNELVVCLESPLSGKEKASSLHSSAANLDDTKSKKTVLFITATKESPAYDLESLRLKLSEQPDFLHKLKVPELKLILKFNKVLRVSKLKKETMIEELTKLLNST